MKLDLKAFQEMDRHLPCGAPTYAVRRTTDVSLYYREDEEGQKASIVLKNAEGKELVDLFMDSPQGLALSMARLHYEGFRLARKLWKKPIGWRSRTAAPAPRS